MNEKIRIAVESVRNADQEYAKAQAAQEAAYNALTAANARLNEAGKQCRLAGEHLLKIAAATDLALTTPAAQPSPPVNISVVDAGDGLVAVVHSDVLAAVEAEAAVSEAPNAEDPNAETPAD